MSENLDLVRSMFGAWERGDFSDTDWADPRIEFVFADGPSPETVSGVAAMSESWRDFLRNWQGVRAEVEQFVELDGDRVLVLFRQHGRGRTSGLEVAQTAPRAANLFHLREGRVTRAVLFLNGDRALADLGLAG